MWRGLALDVGLWYCLPAAFLVVYVERFLAPPSSVLTHLRLLAAPLAALWAIRLILARAAPPRVVRWASSLALATMLAIMLAYYALVVVGLEAWGRVISWDLVRSYASQAALFVDALGISVPLVWVAVLLAYAALLAGTWAYFGRWDWTLAFSARIPLRQTLLVAVATLATSTIELYAFFAAPPGQVGEPVALTFEPEEQDIQGHAVDRQRAAMLDAAEDRARKAYTPGSASRRNVVLIVVDALRPDHMGIYGYGRNTTPHLARLEAAGRLRKATGMRATCASSACGILSISSSRFVHQFSMRPFSLHEVLKRHGYAAHLILSGDHTLFYGLKDAYGPVDSYYDAADARRRGGRYMNDDQLVLDRLQSFPSWNGAPVVFHFHLMSAHVLSKRDPALSPYAPAANYVLSRPRRAIDPAGVNFYDNGVLHADATIARLLSLLEEKGYLGDALVAITADHGEALGEHGYLQHANSVREEVLRVPFLLLTYAPDHPARAFEPRAVASQVDIAPTILAELGLPAPASWQGTPLQSPARHDFVYFRERWETGLYDLRNPRSPWKYWRNNRTGTEYAFELAGDPGEHANAIDRVPAELKREWRARVFATASVGSRARTEDAELERGYPKIRPKETPP